MSGQDKPDWVKNASRHWQEDECLRHDPSAPHLASEWRKRFGVDYRDDPVLETWDDGDMVWHLHAEGRVSVATYEGAEIWQVWTPNPDCVAPCGGLGCGDETCRGRLSPPPSPPPPPSTSRLLIEHHHVEVRSEGAIILGSRVPVRRLWAWHRKGITVETLVKRYPSLGWAKVLDALAFAYDNAELVEQELDRERALFDGDRVR